MSGRKIGDVSSMSMADVSIEKKAGLAVRYLEHREAERLRLSKAEARPSLARRMRLPPGTLANLVRDRIKELTLRAHRAVQKELHRERARLQHELYIHQQIGSDPRSDEIAHIMADIAAVDALIDREGV